LSPSERASRAVKLCFSVGLVMSRRIWARGGGQ
jgi:hypothetical protein